MNTKYVLLTTGPTIDDMCDQAFDSFETMHDAYDSIAHDGKPREMQIQRGDYIGTYHPEHTIYCASTQELFNDAPHLPQTKSQTR